MKRVLILAIGAQLPPWDKMFQTSLETWDSISVDGVDTLFYFGNPVKENTDNAIYFPVEEHYNTMGVKMLSAFDWVLKNKEFDYIARINSSCYVDKKELIKHIQTLPDKNVFSGGAVQKNELDDYLWGGLQWIISKDVIQKFFDNKDKYNHSLMEDVALSYLAKDIGIPFHKGIGCAIDKIENGWRLISYGGGESFEFKDFSEIKNKYPHHFYRCKQDLDRNVDEYVMNELNKILSK
jgi:hypothetical protein